MRRLATDQDALSDFVAEFLDGCGIDPPFYLVSIRANGMVYVTHRPAVGEGREVVTHLPDEAASQ